MVKHLPENGSNHDEYVLIGDAARFLGVSIDTVRRWDEEGKLTSHRIDGKNRYFLVEDLKIFNDLKPLTITQAAKRLKLSISTLRRLEKKGFIEPTRDTGGRRLYSTDCIGDFLKSDYYENSRNTSTNNSSTESAEPNYCEKECPTTGCEYCLLFDRPDSEAENQSKNCSKQQIGKPEQRCKKNGIEENIVETIGTLIPNSIIMNPKVSYDSTVVAASSRVDLPNTESLWKSLKKHLFSLLPLILVFSSMVIEFIGEINPEAGGGL